MDFTKKQFIVISYALQHLHAPIESFSKAHSISGKYYFIDGHRLFVSDIDFGFEHADAGATWRNAESLVKDALKAADDRITLRRDDIQAFIKARGLKRSKRYFDVEDRYIFETEKKRYIAFNPFYLLDYIDFTGADVALCSSKSVKAPMVDADGRALVLPVNITATFTRSDFDAWRDRYFVEIATAI